MLIDSARRNVPLAYGDVMSVIGLDHKDADDRRRFSSVLEDISRYEHSRNNRPMLSAQIMYKNLDEIGDKFYWLANQLNHGPKRKLQADMFEYEMQRQCHEFWSKDLNYRLYKDDVPEVDPFGSKWLLKTTPPPGRSDPPVQTFVFAGTEIDWVAVTTENIQLGAAGELMVVEYEKEMLRRAGRPHLAAKVTKVADGNGYDILSWTVKETEKYIEVKTTAGSKESPFPISANEITFSRQHPEQYYLYRLFNFIAGKSPAQFIEYVGGIDGLFHFEPILFKAWQKSRD
jgi:hypothetical protein